MGNSAPWRKPLLLCIQAAAKAGDIYLDDDGEDEVYMWLTHHIGVMFMFMSLPQVAIVDYRDRDGWVRASMRFMLCGMRMSLARFEEIYQPELFQKALDV